MIVGKLVWGRNASFIRLQVQCMIEKRQGTINKKL